MWLYLVNTFEFDAVRTDVGRLLALALAVASIALLCDKLFAGKKWW